MTMKITVNGDPREVVAPMTMAGLLEQLGLGGKPVVVEHNQLALLPREIAGAALGDGDVIEIIQITAGG